MGQGYFTTIQTEGEDKRNPKVKAKEMVDEFGRYHNLDSMLPNICRISLIAGFCPVESKITPNNPKKSTLKIVHPKTVTDIVSKSGVVQSIKQKVGSMENTIQGKDLAWFTYCQIANDPRGTSFVRGLITILNTLNDATDDVDKILKRYIGPIAVWKQRGDIDNLRMAVRERDPGQDIFIGDMRQEDVDNPNLPQMITIDPRVPYWEYIEYLDRRIYGSSRASHLYYIRNATQASAREMEDIVQRHVGSIQRDIKRTVERDWFEKVVGAPTPKIKFGIEQTGVEDIDPSMFLVQGVNTGLIQQDQYYDILKQMGLDIKAPTGKTQPPQTQPSTQPRTQVTAPQNRGVDPDKEMKEMVGRGKDYNAVYDITNLMRFHAQDMEVDNYSLLTAVETYCWRYGITEPLAQKRVIAKVAALLELEGYTLVDKLQAHHKYEKEEEG